MGWNFDNSYFRELEGFYAAAQPEQPAVPKLLAWNDPLARTLGIPVDEHSPQELTAMFSGSALPPGSNPIALAYAGHQFGHFSPQLGDGRAVLLGEQIAPDGSRFDLQLKGSGRTPFSRNGDGKSALGPALREYLVSEAMAAMNIATTRSLAVIATGETVVRQSAHPGAVLTRAAASHIRIGTFEFFAAHLGADHVRQLANYTIDRHYPAAREADNPYLALLEAVMDAQIRLVASWMNIGFVHGVMNTDNVAISGETIDYGPCAFMDQYSPSTRFSSIDTRGRYAYANQPVVCRWNLTQLGSAMAQIITEDDEQGLDKANILIESFPERYAAQWLIGMRAKLGLVKTLASDAGLAADLLSALQDENVDFTGFFRRLARAESTGADAVTDLFGEPSSILPWLGAWQERLKAEDTSAEDRQHHMNMVNPVNIPRNHKVEEALAAAESGDMGPFNRLLNAVSHPYDEREEWAEFAGPAPENFGDYVTFCGT